MAHTPGRSILALSGYHFVNFVANRPREVAACPGLPFFFWPSRLFVYCAGLAVTWLGTSSGAPTLKRNVSCIALRLPRASFLVDAGEGTCRQARRLPNLPLWNMTCATCIIMLHFS